MPAGRPTKYRPEMCQTVIDVAATGAGVAEIACELDITKETFYQWVKQKPEFSDAFKIAKQKCQAWWEKQGRRLDGGDLNHGLWKLNMVNRFPNDWADKKEVEHSVEKNTLKDLIRGQRNG